MAALRLSAMLGWEIQMNEDETEKIVDDLAELVKRLSHALSKAAPDNALPSKAMDYLKRHELLRSPLRIQACRESDRKMAATQEGTEMICAAIKALNIEAPNALAQGREHSERPAGAEG